MNVESIWIYLDTKKSWFSPRKHPDILRKRHLAQQRGRPRGQGKIYKLLRLRKTSWSAQWPNVQERPKAQHDFLGMGPVHNSEVSKKSVQSMKWNIANKLNLKLVIWYWHVLHEILAPDPSILQPRDAKPCLSSGEWSDSKCIWK